MKALLFSNDETACASVIEALSNVGFEVLEIALADAAERLATEKPDLLLLDLGDDEAEVLRTCRMLREESQVSLVTLGSDERWLVPALTAGADAYLAKPIRAPMLIAQVFALMRRAGFSQRGRQVITVRDLEIDLDRFQVSLAGEPIQLTPIEYRILATLGKHAGSVISARDLLREAQGSDGDPQSARDIVKVHIYHLRRKLGGGALKGKYVRTVPGFGYTLERRVPVIEEGSKQSWVKRGVPLNMPSLDPDGDDDANRASLDSEGNLAAE